MKIKLYFLVIFLLFVPLSVWGDSGGLCSTEGLVPCKLGECTICHLFELFVNIINIALSCVVPLLATFLFLYGGIVFYLSRGIPEKINKGRNIMTHTVVGVIIIYGAWVIVNSFLIVLGVSDDWAKIDCTIVEPPATCTFWYCDIDESNYCQSIIKEDCDNPPANHYASQEECKNETTCSDPEGTINCTVVSNTEIKITYSDIISDEDVTLFRSNEFIYSIQNEDGTYNDSNLDPNTSYTYILRNGPNLSSPKLNETTCTTNTYLLDAPENVSCPYSSLDTISISWGSVDSANTYKIFRCSGECVPTYEVQETENTSWINTGLSADTVYKYRVRAYNDEGDSDYSATTSCKTNEAPEPIPEAPVAPTIACTVMSSSSIKVSWDNISNATKYNVFRFIKLSGFSPVGVTSNISWINSELENNTTYYYKVTAENDAGESLESNTASCTTQNTASSDYSLSCTNFYKEGNNAYIDYNYSVSNFNGDNIYILLLNPPGKTRNIHSVSGETASGSSSIVFDYSNACPSDENLSIVMTDSPPMEIDNFYYPQGEIIANCSFSCPNL